jgi:hypothetical protein
VHLHDDDPEVMELLLEHCYGFDTRAALTKVTPKSTSQTLLVRLVNLYVAADKYMVQTLMDVVSAEFKCNAAKTWESTFNQGSEFESLISLIYKTFVSPSNIIRLTAVTETARSLETFRHDDEARVRSILEEHPDFAIDLVFNMGSIVNQPPVSEEGAFPLHRAAEAGDLTLVRELLQGRSRGMGRRGVDEQDFNGETPLHFAAWAGHIAVTRALIEEGHADINFKRSSYGKSPLYWARQMNFQNVVDYLVQRGARDD